MRVEFDEETGRVLLRVWKCDCNREVCSDGSGGDIACECGQLFNAFGQRLIDPRLWEENEDY